MKHPSLRLRRFTGLIAAFFLIAAAALAQSPVGHWEGTIKLPSIELGIRVDLTAADAGTIDIPVQGFSGFRLSEVDASSSKVSFRMPNVPGDPIFNGTVSEDGKHLTGDFHQNGQTFSFALERKGAATAAAGDTPSRGMPGEGLAGHWQGSLSVGPAQLRLALHVESDGEQLSATLDSIDQGATGMPVASISLEGQQVAFAMPAINASYRGELSADGAEIVGQWKQGPGEAPLVFRRLAHVAKLQRPQEPAAPFPYEVRDVTFPGGEPDVSLAGTLTLPSGEGPFPAVVLLSGSGPQDRNETLMGHRPFLILADHLTRAGIAVLRFDDRGYGASTGNFGAATIVDFAADGRAALEFLQQQPKIDAERIGLCGHSEGGVHAPLIAADHDDVAFIVMLAGVGVPLEDLLHTQRDDIMRVAGIRAEARARQREISEATFAVLHREGATDLARTEIRQILEDAMAVFTPEQRQALGMGDGAIQQQIAMMVSPWFVHLLSYDPAPALAKVHCPVLALNGEKDVQVACEANLEGIRAGLAAGGNTDVTIVALPGLNHLFQTADTGAFSEYGTIEETMSPVVLERVAAWIRATTDA